ncbi:hypothetical protein [Brevibacillus choshinensis]|uniref:Uncharacterized protein n=1 Tax=Brevibacillus choshinensis TaxID=54911 RepID=A0ABX7FKY4_BRECH|nr:hypothetical protein [Brevibacillus choshinensis]QRG65976.1 hypothetical protein JNE38_20680 [Brevibacillus choshinensis]
MGKSMYFIVQDNSIEKIIEKLQGMPVEFQIEMRGENTIFVFTDVPVRVYGELRKIFDCDCLLYKRVRRINRRRKRQ